MTRLRANDDPESTGDDDEVTLVAVDRGTGVLLTNFGLRKVSGWDGADSPSGRLLHPTDVAIDRDGRVAVTDTGNRRVLLLQHDGTQLTLVREFRGFLEPTGIAADGRGGFYVCDRRFQTVFHLDTETGERTTFGLEVAFERPIDVATIPEGDRMARGKKRVIAILDQDGGRVRLFDPAGALRATRTASSLAAEGAAFDAIDIDYYGNVFAVDRRGNRVHKFRDDLYPLHTFGRRDGRPGFRAPRGIAINRRLGQVFLSEEAGGLYLWVGTDVIDLEVEDLGNSVIFRYVVTEDSNVSARVLDPAGEEIVELIRGSYQRAGPQRGAWDGTDADRRRVRPGDYVLELRARATYASRSTYEKRALEAFTLGRVGG